MKEGYVLEVPVPDNPFRAGDRVLCVKSDRGDETSEGEEYVVNHVSGSCIGLVGLPIRPFSGLPFGYYHFKFRPVKYRTEMWLSDDLWDHPMEKADG